MRKFALFFLLLLYSNIYGKPNWHSPPAWMREQIETDLSLFEPEEIAPAQLDRIDQMLHPLIVRYRIKNGTLQAIYPPSPIKITWVRGRAMESFFQQLLKITDVSDVDFLVSMSDKGEGLSAPFFSFAKDGRSKEAILLIPDFEALSGNPNMLTEVKEGVKKYPWKSKLSKAIWRGSMTGQHFTLSSFLHAPRSQLVTHSLHYPTLIDARFSAITQCSDPKEIESAFGEYFSNPLSIRTHLRYKYQILVDGNSCAYSRAYWQLFSNALILKQESPDIQWFYACLKPYVHYIPVRTNFEDLIEQIQWAQAHDEECQQISENAQAFANQNLTRDHVFLYLYLLLEAYAKKQNESL